MSVITKITVGYFLLSVRSNFERHYVEIAVPFGAPDGFSMVANKKLAEIPGARTVSDSLNRRYPVNRLFYTLHHGALHAFVDHVSDISASAAAECVAEIARRESLTSAALAEAARVRAAWLTVEDAAAVRAERLG